MAELFVRKNAHSKDSEQEKKHVERLERKVGQLTVELDWLSKKSKELGIGRWVETGDRQTLRGTKYQRSTRSNQVCNTLNEARTLRLRKEPRSEPGLSGWTRRCVGGPY